MYFLSAWSDGLLLNTIIELFNSGLLPHFRAVRDSW